MTETRTVEVTPRAMVADDIGMGPLAVAERAAVRAILVDLRDRRLLKYLFAADPDNVGAYGYVEAPIDLQTQHDMVTKWVRLASQSLSTDEEVRRLPDSPWFLIAIGGKVGDRFRNTVILDCSPDMKDLGPEFHWEDTFETEPPEHLPAGAYIWSGFQLGGWAEDDPIVAKGGAFTAYAALQSKDTPSHGG